MNTVEASLDGTTGLLPSYFLLDAVVSYQIAKWNSAVNLSVKKSYRRAIHIDQKATGNQSWASKIHHSRF
ncbi:hypothetical protein [Algoriphagus boritolerans]|uniref:hypothetical protein n=1 Tax=Algoriphagus boritolerans TaxID=308111 RepID=UPI000A8BF41E